MAFKITGHSGCIIELLQDKGGFSFIRKSPPNSAYAPRLKAQIEKQRFFGELALPKTIDVPEVYGFRDAQENSYTDMEFIPSSDYINFFLGADTHQVRYVTDALCEFIDFLINKAQLVDFDSSVFMDKFAQVSHAIMQNEALDSDEIQPILQHTEKVFSAFSPKTPLPVGICHGDLTFSNILFSQTSSRITLIDFLDSFIESPMQDIVKIRQDTFFCWSFMMYPHNFNRVRLEAIMKTIDKMVDAHCLQYPFYTQYYRVFQMMNLLRILPYVNREETIVFVTHAIRHLTKD